MKTNDVLAYIFSDYPCEVLSAKKKFMETAVRVLRNKNFVFQQE